MWTRARASAQRHPAPISEAQAGACLLPTSTGSSTEVNASSPLIELNCGAHADQIALTPDDVVMADLRAPVELL